MLNEWSDRDPEPPSPWRDRMVVIAAVIIGAGLVWDIARWVAGLF